MQYEGDVYRPPSEARSLIIQVTIGCSHNTCTFCHMYSDKKFRVRKREEILRDLEECSRDYGEYVNRVFFADGDALDFSIRNNVEEATDAAHKAVEFCNENGVEPNLSHDIGVALEELCVNTAKYASSARSDMVDIFLKITPEAVVLKVRDNGKIFNPTEYMDHSGEMITGLELIRTISSKITTSFC